MATTTITYEEYKEARQAEFDSLPIFWAFSNEQLEEGMKKHWNKAGKCPSVKNAGKYLYAFGNGGFYFKTDAPKIHAYLKRDDPLDELMRNPEFAESAFYYEMGNHEYHINHYQGNWDVLSCFGNIEYNDNDDPKEYFKQLNLEPQTIEAFWKARKRFLHNAMENDWY